MSRFGAWVLGAFRRKANLKLDFILEHKKFYATFFLIAAIIIAVDASAYYYYQESSGTCPNPCQGSTVTINTLINYGNGTAQWINKTDVPSDWNFYQLTNSIANVQATFSSSISEHFVSGINGVQGNGQYFWSLWVVCQKSNAWMAANVGADGIHLAIYRTLAWYYQATTSQDSSAWNVPVPGSLKVNAC